MPDYTLTRRNGGRIVLIEAVAVFFCQPYRNLQNQTRHPLI
jgi:hypothetical protein